MGSCTAQGGNCNYEHEYELVNLLGSIAYQHERSADRINPLPWAIPAHLGPLDSGQEVGKSRAADSPAFPATFSRSSLGLGVFFLFAACHAMPVHPFVYPSSPTALVRQGARAAVLWRRRAALSLTNCLINAKLDTDNIYHNHL